MLMTKNGWTKVQSVLPKSRLLVAGMLVLVLAAPAAAASMKSIMGSLGETTKAAKAVLTAFDPAKAQAILQTYARDAQLADAAFASVRDPKAQDLRARFHQFTATIASARASATDQTSFRSAFLGIASECRSCHAVYK